MPEEEGIKVLAKNRKARFEYTIDETIEAGIQLLGTEVKSFRAGQVSFPDAYAFIKDGEAWLKGLHVAEYAFSAMFNHEPDRVKKLLLHRREIKRLTRKVEEKGYTLVPLLFYLKHGLVKVEIALCKGRKNADKRAAIKDRDVARDMQREMRERNSRD